MISMKTYEGKTTVFNYYENGYLEYAFDRAIFSNRTLYPGNTWKRAHYIIFGYYPKDWDDMCSIKNNEDYRTEANLQYDQESEYSVKNCSNNEELDFDDYDVLYEIIKFVFEKEVEFDERIHYYLTNKNIISFRAGQVLGRLANSIGFISECSPVFLEKYKELNLTKYTWLTFDEILKYFIYQKSLIEKNPVEEAAKEKANDKAKEALKEGKFTKYLNIKTKLYSDEVIKIITESFNKAVIPTFKDASKQSKEFFKVVEKAVKSGNFRLANLKETKNGFSFVLKNKDIRFDFDDKGNVNYKITPVSFEEQAAK